MQYVMDVMRLDMQHLWDDERHMCAAQSNRPKLYMVFSYRTLCACFTKSHDALYIRLWVGYRTHKCAIEHTQTLT